MSKGRHSRWTKLLALSIPLYLASCASAEHPTMSALPPAGEDAAYGDSQMHDVDIMRIAERMRANGDVRNAAAMYQQAHLSNPNAVAPLVKLGDTLIEIGAADDAADAYSKALAIEPKNAAALRGLGLSRVLLSQPEFAIGQFESALAINGGDARAYNGLGVALDMLGQHRAAQAAYRKALDIAPNNGKVLNNLGLSLILTGNAAEAVGVLERVNNSPSATALTRQNLALAYGLSGRLDAAERIARIDLRQPAVEQNLAFYASHQGRNGIADLARILGVRQGEPYDMASRQPTPDDVAEPEPRQSTAESRQPAAERQSDSDTAAAGSLAAPPATDTGAPRMTEPERREADFAVAEAPPLPLMQPAVTGTPIDAPEQEEDNRSVSIEVASDDAEATPAIPDTLFPPVADLVPDRPDTEPEAEPAPVAAASSRPAPPAADGESPSAAETDAAPAAVKTASAADTVKDAPSPGTALKVITLPPTPQPASPPIYRVQLAAYRSPDAASRGWKNLTATQSDLLQGFEPFVYRVDLGPDKGVFFRLQTGGFADQTDARALCRDLKSRQFDCMVVQASTGEDGGATTVAATKRVAEPRADHRS